MPTYEEALAANPEGFVDYAAEMTSAGTDLTDHQTEYDQLVTTINASWRDRANAAFNEDVDIVDVHVEDVVSQVDRAAEALSTGGGQMVTQVGQLRATDAAYRGAGFDVRSEPRVALGAVHWAAIAAAGPFGPVLQAMYQARADEGTVRLQLGLAMLNATDAITGAALTAAAQELQPLEDKGGSEEQGHTICPPAIGADDDPVDTNRRSVDDDEGGNGKDDEDGKGEKDDEGEKEKKDEKEKDGEDGEKDEQEQPQDDRPGPEQQEPGPRQPDAGLPEDRIPGMEQPDPVSPAIPDYQSPDLASPEIPDYESDWDPSELGGAELPSGGLAGGGGLGGGGLSGGGVGTPDLPSGGSGATSGGVFAAPAASGAPAPATGPGARPGTGGFMGGAPGSRTVPDDEVERESFLVEDPEEDVWGIGTEEDNPYVDYQEEQRPAESELPPLGEVPPFTLPGFDLPNDRS